MKVALLLLLVLVACKSHDDEHVAKKTPAGTTPEQLVALSCTACHGADILAQQHLTDKQWEAGVKKMVGWGALVEDKDQAPLAAYLAAHYTPTSAPYAVPETSGDALAAIEPTDDGTFAKGDVSRGKTFYVQACAACHGADGRGNAIGVNLVDRYLLYRASDFAAIVRAGRGRMPPASLADAPIADVLAYLRTLHAET